MTELSGLLSRPTVPGHFASIETSDIDKAVTMIKEVADHRPQVRLLDPSAAGFDVRTASFGAYGSDRIRINGIRYRGSAAPTQLLLAGVMVRGHGRLFGSDLDLQLTAGDGFLGPTNMDYDAEYDNPAFTVVRLPLPCVAVVAEQTSGISAAEFRFRAHTPSSAVSALRWARTIEFVAGQLADQQDEPPADLTVAELFRLVAVTSLATFANTATTAHYLPSAGFVAPASLRRAIAFIEAHAGEPITATHIAEQAGVGLRALQEAFRRYLETSPTAYLRRIRLERAHLDLQMSDPVDGSTVDAIARRWGFTHHSRFTAQYRAAYGQLPSHTLRT